MSNIENIYDFDEGAEELWSIRDVESPESPYEISTRLKS